MAQPLDIATLHSTLTSALISTTRTVSELCAEDLAFHRQLDPRVGQQLDRQSTRLLDLAEKLIHNAASDGGGEDIKLRVEDDEVKEVIDAQWSQLVDVVDGLLERADASLDEYTGAVKRGQVQRDGEGQLQTQSAAKPAASKVNVLRQQDMTKPQLQFDQAPDNQPRGLWTPLLTTKPHAKVPLNESICLTTSKDEDGNEYEHHAHPYAEEIRLYEYPQTVETVADPIPPLKWQSTTATLVDTMQGVQEMLAELKQANEIAVDLEHHDYRTYTGLTSLMQISTRTKDYIVDTLKPWRQDLQVLNEVFADPSVLKVLHGSSMDMIWLQRDLGIYVVGLFDTYHACRALRYPRAGLDFLLSKFVNFQAQKKYQRADWRIRPLPEELFDYARSDTHFLLYIYDRMRNELLESSSADEDLLQIVLDRSKEESLQHYEYPVYRDDGTGSIGWLKPLLNTSAMLSKEQFSVFKAVHSWRDNVAREEDESTPYIMPNHALFATARDMPVDKPGLFGTLQGISLPVRLRADELVSVIKRAKEHGKHGPELNEALGIHLGKRKRTGPDSSVGAAVKRIQLEALESGSLGAKVPQPANTSNVDHVRTEASTFWGSALPTIVRTAVPASASATDDAAVRLALPLPHLTAQVYADASGPAVTDNGAASRNPASMAEHPYIAAEGRQRPDHDDDIFTVRQAGGKKRRRHDVDARDEGVEQPEPVEIYTGAGDSSAGGASNAVDGSPNQSKKARKRARKRERERLEASEHGASNGGNGPLSPSLLTGLGTDADLVKVDDADEAFDYSTAQSILHPAHDAADTPGRRRKKDKGFDPYQKALNAPKGLPKKQKDRGGKSMTFPS